MRVGGSCFQSSIPVLPSAASKNKAPFTAVSSAGNDELPPGKTSATRAVKPVAGSCFQSSTPVMPSSAMKNKAPFTAVSWKGTDEPPPGKMSVARLNGNSRRRPLDATRLSYGRYEP